MPITFDVPNLDCASTDPADYRELQTALYLLQRYATHKRRSMKYRLAGKINDAVEEERMMDSLYHDLPEWAKW